MNRSPETAAISKALVAAQAEMKNPGFDAKNPHFGNKFASLAAIRNAVVPVLTKNGISVTQDLTTTDSGWIACTTILTHESGQFFEFGPLKMPATKQDAQGFGSASTYCKRYALQSVCGIVGDDDDDANAASKEWTGKDTKDANFYASALVKAVEKDDDVEIKRLGDEFINDQEFYLAVFAKIPKPLRARVSSIIQKERTEKWQASKGITEALS